MRTAPRRLRRGTTLIELLVTLAILGIIAGVTVLAVRQMDRPRPTDPRTILADTLRAVLASGRPAIVRVITDSGPASAVVRADGSIIADSLLDVDRFTGASNHAR